MNKTFRVALLLGATIPGLAHAGSLTVVGVGSFLDSFPPPANAFYFPKSSLDIYRVDDQVAVTFSEAVPQANLTGITVTTSGGVSVASEIYAMPNGTQAVLGFTKQNGTIYTITVPPGIVSSSGDMLTQGSTFVAYTPAAAIPPSGLSYPASPLTLNTNQQMVAATPSLSNVGVPAVTSYSISPVPALPAGVTFTSTGTSAGSFSGTPTTNQAQQTYTVTAYNAWGSTSAQVAISVVSPIVYSSVVQGDHPWAYFRLNESGGTVATDSSGNGRNGVYTGLSLSGPNLVNNDAGGASVSSHGQADYMKLSPSSYPTDNKISVECWVNLATADLPGYGTVNLVDNGNAGNANSGFEFEVTGQGALEMSIAGEQTLSANNLITAGSIAHIAGTYDGNGNTNLYINGANVGSSSGGSWPAPWVGQASSIYFGVLDNGGVIGNGLSGQMSECALYDGVLSATEVLNHYNAGAGLVTPPPTPLISYNLTSACINGQVYTNTGLGSSTNAPHGEGEFDLDGLDRSYWGGPHTRTESPTATWNGFQTSWGRHQYDCYFGDSSDGLGYDPFNVGPDTGAPGSPQALSILAENMPANIANSLAVMANDQYIVTSASAPFSVPANGGSLTVNVANPTSAQDGWRVGIGYQGGAITFIGTLTSGGNPSGTGTGGSNPWTISNVVLYSGTAGTTVTPGVNDEGGFRAYNFPQYYCGTLDTNINQQYGFFVERIRVPQPIYPGISPAWWMLETGGVGNNAGQILRSEWDIEEMFSNLNGNSLNAGNILWNSGNISYGCGESCSTTNNATNPGATGVYPWPTYQTSFDYQNYHDYGVLISPPGSTTPAFPTNYSGSAEGVYVENNNPFQGTTFFLDGVPLPGHIGQPDLTQGSPDKEIMTMFQVGSPDSWLDPSGKGASNPWPLTMNIQFLRVYVPTGQTCSN